MNLTMSGPASPPPAPLSRVVSELGTRWEDREVRGKVSADGGVVLYKKWKMSGSDSNHDARVLKRATAREYVEKAIVSEFNKRGDAFGTYAQGFLDILKADLRSIPQDGLKMKELTRMNNRIGDAQKLVASFNTAHKEVSVKPDYRKADYAEGMRILSGVEGFSAEMNIEAGMKLYLKLAADLPSSGSPGFPAASEKLDALKQWIDDGTGKLEADKLRTLAKDRMKTAASGGNQHLQTSAQHAELSRIGTRVGKTGLCARLCPMVALAEARAPDGDNPVLTRLAKESSGAGLPGPAPFAVHLEGLSANSTFVRGCPAAKIPHPGGPGEAPIDVPRTKCSELADSLTNSPAFRRDGAAFRGLEVGGHVMMVGVVQKPGGENRFVFYDPDSGLARFDTREQLSSYLDKYFGAQGYGERHHMTKHEGEYAFTSMKDYDIGVLSTVVPAPSSAAQFATWVPPTLDGMLSPEPG